MIALFGGFNGHINRGVRKQNHRDGIPYTFERGTQWLEANQDGQGLREARKVLSESYERKEDNDYPEKFFR